MNNNELQQINRLIKGDIYKANRNALVSPDEKTKHSIVNDFVPAFLKEAVKNPT